MKKFITLLILGILLTLTFLYRDQIIKYVLNEYIYHYANVEQIPDEYTKDLEISFVKKTDNFFPKNRQDILNIFYTSLNNGVDTFIYYCTDEYEGCIEESEKIANDDNLLSNINNFVHPYNSYSTLAFQINSFGKVEVTVEKQYTEEEIAQINQKVKDIIHQVTNHAMTNTEKIKAVHDYIIQNSSYDTEKADSIVDGVITKESPYKSETAYGVLLQGYGICSGFSDTMEIFLTNFEIPSYKITSVEHMWNLVFIDNQWKHLDLTWDNPVVNGGGKMLLHDFFLIDYKTLITLDTGHHTFDQTIYKEAT